MMARAQGFNPQGPLSGVYGGRPTDVRQAKFGSGFWGKLGKAATTIASSAVGGLVPFKWGSKQPNVASTQQLHTRISTPGLG